MSQISCPSFSTHFCKREPMKIKNSETLQSHPWKLTEVCVSNFPMKPCCHAAQTEKKSTKLCNVCNARSIPCTTKPRSLNKGIRYSIQITDLQSQHEVNKQVTQRTRGSSICNIISLNKSQAGFMVVVVILYITVLKEAKHIFITLLKKNRSTAYSKQSWGGGDWCFTRRR